jgi:hypothetical protein
MRPTDRDYCVSTIAVLQDQLRMIQDVASDMTMRLDELDETLLYLYGQKEDEELDELMTDSWESGYAYSMHLAQKDAEAEPTSPRLCMCDECWDVTNDQGDCDCDDCRCDDEYDDKRVNRPESKKEYFDWIDDVLRMTRRDPKPRGYRVD